MEFREPFLLKLRDWNPIDEHGKQIDMILPTNQLGIYFIENNFNYWNYLSTHPKLIPLIMFISDHITWEYISGIKFPKVNNISDYRTIFTYNYWKIKEIKTELNKEVCEYRRFPKGNRFFHMWKKTYWHPKRMNLWQWQEED